MHSYEGTKNFIIMKASGIHGTLSLLGSSFLYFVSSKLAKYPID